MAQSRFKPSHRDDDRHVDQRDARHWPADEMDQQVPGEDTAQADFGEFSPEAGGHSGHERSGSGYERESDRYMSSGYGQDSRREDSGDGHPSRSSVSHILRDERQNAGYSLRDVSSILRIRLAHLEAIEDGRFDDLPGLVYAVGFIRAYSDLIGLDGEAMVKSFKQEVSGVQDHSELHFPTPSSEGRLPGMALVTIAVLLAGVAYGGWYYVSDSDRSMGDMIPAIPERFAGLLDGWTGDAPTAYDLVEESVTVNNGSPAGSTAANVSPTDSSALSSGAGVSGGSDPSVSVEPAAPASSAAPDSVASSDNDADGGAADQDGSGNAAPDLVDGDLAAGDLVDGINGAGDQSMDSEGAGSEGGVSGSALPLAVVTPPVVIPDDEGGQAPSVIAPAPTAGTVMAVPGFDDPPALDGALAATGPEAGSPSGEANEGGESPDDTLALSQEGDGQELGGGASLDDGLDGARPQILIRAEADSWVQIRDDLGTLLMTRVMRPGEVYEVPEDAGLTMVTGNAGGLYVTVDGEPAPSLGSSGDVVRGIRLEPDALLQGTASP